jgi:threonine dehydrogenase-like Zn-dependent dehydrogenase
MFECMLVAKSLLRKAEPWIAKDKTIIILGAGPIVISAAILLQTLYGAECCLYDILPARSERAKHGGYNVVSQDALGKKYHLVLDCAGANTETGGSAFMDGLKCVGKGGALMVAGTYLHTTAVSPIEIIAGEVTIAGTYGYADQDLSSLTSCLDKINLNLPSELI